jgi:TonB family protein
MRLPAVVACVVSIGLHLAFLFLLPSPAWQSLDEPPPPTDVEFVAVDIPARPTFTPPPDPPAPTEPPPPLNLPPEAPTYDPSKIAQLDMRRIDGTLEAMSAGASMRLGMPALQLPTQQPLEVPKEALPLPELDANNVVAALLEPSPLVPGRLEGAEKPMGLDPLPLGDKPSPSRMGLPAPDRAVLAPPPAATAPIQPPAVPAKARFGIEGPVAKREPLAPPDPPQVIVPAESEISLKFWVRPDGVVSRVLPVRRGDAGLEAAAIRYIEGWRFTPLPPHEQPVEQWGTITVRFLPPGR